MLAYNRIQHEKFAAPGRFIDHGRGSVVHGAQRVSLGYHQVTLGNIRQPAPRVQGTTHQA
ncbi:MAG: hypothetical protein NVS3B11_28220 [Collimonas sp.]